MKRSLNKLSINELRNMAVALGADRKRLYGTSKVAMIQIIFSLERESEALKKREELKTWARENNVTGLVAELVANDINIDDALRYVWDMKNLTKDEFKAKYFM